jgi:hypothetical protein
MPFDATGFRKPTVTVLPPSLREPAHDVRISPVVPERGGEPPRRIHIVIEIVDRHRPMRHPRSALWWWIVAFGLIALAAHAQEPPREWRSYPFGSGTNSYGTDRQGREWIGRSFDVGSHTITVITDPAGRERRCESYVLGTETITRCDP